MPVEYFDERFSTVTAQQALRASGRSVKSSRGSLIRRRRWLFCKGGWMRDDDAPHPQGWIPVTGTCSVDDEQYRHSRHRGTAGQDVSQDDVDRLRFFTQPHPDRPVNGRRRHRDEVGGTDPESSRAMPQRIEPRPAPEERGPVPAPTVIRPAAGAVAGTVGGTGSSWTVCTQVPPPPRPAESTGPVDAHRGSRGIAPGRHPDRH